MKKNQSNLAVVGGKNKQPRPVRVVADCGVYLHNADSLDASVRWPAPTCIISDGPYGLGKFPGEQKTTQNLADWYAPHVARWSAAAEADTTLWFWNTELGWALVHPVLELLGWQYEECVIWDKGIAHIAGNCNSKTIRGVPVVTEICARYTRKHRLASASGDLLSIKDWVRAEWNRSGLPMSRSNEACGVKNAATRKYLTQCHLWYFPPPEAIVRMAAYCTQHGKPTSRPYFSLDGDNPITEAAWSRLRSKWNHTHGLTNVWSEPAVHGSERLKGVRGYLHATQKPLSLMTRQILACTDPGDAVWEPFGGTCSAAIAARLAGRRAYAAEINEQYFSVAAERLLALREVADAERNAG